MGRNILNSSVQNAFFSIIFQVLFRCITFILNAFIIRTVGQDVLGIMHVRLLLLESTILFLSREPILKACLTDSKSHNWGQVINQIWLSTPLSAALGLGLAYVWTNILSPPENIYLQQYKIGCYAIALSCFIEQITESAILVAQSFCFVKLKVAFETIYVVSRTIIFVFLVIQSPDNAINAFSVAQVASSVILCLLYYGFFMWYIKKLNGIKEITEQSDLKHKEFIEEKNIFYDMHDFPFKSIYDFLPGYMENKEGFLNKKLCLLTGSFAKQSIIKQVLTEGERYIMTIFPLLTFSEQSIYDIINNLGSLAARFLFRPIEDSAYFYFTQMIKRDVVLKDQDQKNVTESADVLSHLCKVVMSIGLVIVIFGQTYSYTLLYIYGGSRLIENTLPVTLLKTHSFAIVLLAVNGVTEGFVFATMSNKQLDRYNYLMVIFSITFLVISYFFTLILGPVGFIIANCINMLARISHSVYYIFNKYQDTDHKPLNGLRPSFKFITILILSGVFTKMSEVIFLKQSVLLHIGVGAFFFVLTLLIWAYENMLILKTSYKRYRKISLKEE